MRCSVIRAPRGSARPWPRPEKRLCKELTTGPGGGRVWGTECLCSDFPRNFFPLFEACLAHTFLCVMPHPTVLCHIPASSVSPQGDPDSVAGAAG